MYVLFHIGLASLIIFFPINIIFYICMNEKTPKRNIYVVSQAILNTIKNKEENLYHDIHSLYRHMSYDPPELETLHWNMLAQFINNAFANINYTELSSWGKDCVDIFTGKMDYSKIKFIASRHRHIP